MRALPLAFAALFAFCAITLLCVWPSLPELPDRTSQNLFPSKQTPQHQPQQPPPAPKKTASAVAAAVRRLRDIARGEDVHRPGRNLSTHPIVVAMARVENGEQWLGDCDVPCVLTSGGADVPYADVVVTTVPGSGTPQLPQGARCTHTKTAVLSMESAVNYPRLALAEARKAFDIVATYDLDSDVPVQYFSWAEYDFAQKTPWPKTAGAMMAVVISNCRDHNGRLAYLRELIENGVTVHSYGKCMRNAEMPKPERGVGYLIHKNNIIAPYKFTAAFENSNTKDYVTEKLFGPLVAGSVPVHMGVENVHDFAPPHSVISTHDFPSAKDLAKYLLYLDRNDTAYKEYLAWKDRVPEYSTRFKALMDISKVHSSCRMCIHAADRFRREIGMEAQPEQPHQTTQRPNELTINVRERGTFWSTPVFLRERTLSELKSAAIAALQKSKTTTSNRVVWSVYDRYDRRVRIESDQDVEDLSRGRELEVVIVDC